MINEFINIYPITTYVFFGLVCLAIGSLLNVVIYRLPLILEAEWTVSCRNLLQLPEEQNPPLNLFYPRSFCPSCKTLIPAWHNIPLFSYIILRGHCHTCHSTIPFRYPLVEALCLILSLSAALTFGFTIQLLFVLLFLWIIICLFVIDLQHQLLPDSLTLSLLWLGLMVNTLNVFTPLSNAVWSAAGAYLSLWLFIKLFYLITGKVGMGNGDFKLFAAFGAWFGWTQLPLILLISSLTGAITGLIYLKKTGKTRSTPIPYGPFLCIAGVTSLFFGKDILKCYLTLYVY